MKHKFCNVNYLNYNEKKNRVAMNPLITKNGNKFWYDSEGEYHREDGPAIEKENGNKLWFKHGKCHREDGPAYEADEDKYYYLEHIQYSEEEYWKKIKQLKKCKLFKLDKGNIGWL